MSARSAMSAALDRVQLRKSFAAVPLRMKFQVWPGARDNEIEVRGADLAFWQLVLRVKEPRRRFVEVVRTTPSVRFEAVAEHARAGGGRVLKETRYDWRLEMWTPVEDRRYLCGWDDLQLFIARLPEGETVAEAQEALKPDEVRRAEALVPGAVRRQGEWFFLLPSDEETEPLERALRDRPRAVRRAAPVGGGGRPHVADFLVGVDRRTRSRHREYRRLEVFARRGSARRPPFVVAGRMEACRPQPRAGRDAPSTRRVQWID